MPPIHIRMQQDLISTYKIEQFVIIILIFIPGKTEYMSVVLAFDKTCHFTNSRLIFSGSLALIFN